MARRRLGERLMERLERSLIGGKIGLARRHAGSHQGERGKKPAQRGIGGELAQEGLGIDDAVEQMGELPLVEEEQPLAVEIGIGVGTADGAKMGGIARERGGERGGGGVCRFRNGRVDDDDEEIALAGKGAGEFHLLLPPGEAFGKEVIGVGIDAEEPPDREPGEQDEKEGEPRDKAGGASGPLGEPGKKGGDHGRTPFEEPLS